MYLCAMMQELLLDKKRRRSEAKLKLQVDAKKQKLNMVEEEEEEEENAGAGTNDANVRVEQYAKNRKFMIIKDSLCMSYVLRCLFASMCSIRVSV